MYLRCPTVQTEKRAAKTEAFAHSSTPPLICADGGLFVTETMDFTGICQNIGPLTVDMRSAKMTDKAPATLP